jgi:flagellar hook protein FlgE
MSHLYYTSLSGMMAASLGLQNTANNIANMQQKGYKRKSIQFSSLYNPDEKRGFGVTKIGTQTIFSDGKYENANSKTNLAIIGKGFFIINYPDGRFGYTRNGDFSQNEKNELIDTITQGRVMCLDKSGQLIPLILNPKDTYQGRATKSVHLQGQMLYKEKEKPKDNSSTDPTPNASLYEPITFNLDNIYDKKGNKHTLSITLAQGMNGNDPKTWVLKDAHALDDLSVDFTEQTISFNTDNNGTADTPNNKLSLTIDGDNTLTIDFGSYLNQDTERVALKKATGSYETSNLTIYQQDGYPEGQSQDYSIDENGTITYVYSNGEKREGSRIALAYFLNDNLALKEYKNAHFTASPLHNPRIYSANSNGMGLIKQQQIELSNVDTTDEFSTIVCLQRIFQGSSQLIDIEKQLIESLERK